MTLEEFKLKYNTIELGDSYKIIKELPDKCVDLIVTDPPYEIECEGSNNNLGTSIKSGMIKELKNSDIVDGINEEILDQFMRIMKKPNIYIWCNKKQVPMYLDYFVNKHDCSFEILTWCKTNPTPLCGGNYLIDKEFCLYFRKNVRLNTTFETAFTYWIDKKNIQDKKLFDHPTIKPLEIIKKLIINSSNVGDVVFDPFGGSGTTAVAAKDLDRNYYLIEIDPEWHKISNDRTNQIVNDGQLSMFSR